MEGCGNGDINVQNSAVTQTEEESADGYHQQSNLRAHSHIPDASVWAAFSRKDQTAVRGEQAGDEYTGAWNSELAGILGVRVMRIVPVSSLPFGRCILAFGVHKHPRPHPE